MSIEFWQLVIGMPLATCVGAGVGMLLGRLIFRRR